MGTVVHVFQDVYVSRLLREAHIFISLLNEERKGERERERKVGVKKIKCKRSEEGSPMTEIRQK